MDKRRGSGQVAIPLLLFGLGVLFLTLAPYLLAPGLTPRDKVFSGFLLNPADGFTYLAKMRQGYQGAWAFRLPYTIRPGEPAFLFVYHLFLGHVARASGLAPLAVYHGARLLGGMALFLLVVRFCRWALDEPAQWAGAVLLIMVGGGLGWLGVPFGFLGSDLTVPESIPFLTVYVNAHFGVAAAALLGGLLSIVVAEGRLARLAALALLAGTVVGAVQPFAAAIPAAVVPAWLCVEYLKRRPLSLSAWVREPSVLHSLLTLGAFVLGVMPWAAYDAWLTVVHPAIAGWAQQNQTPSPSPWAYMLGFGLLLPLAALGARRAWPTPRGRLMVVWIVIQAALLYAPFPLQRRLALGLYFPLAVLAVEGLEELRRRGRDVRRMLIFVLLLSVPSNALVVGLGLLGVRQGRSPVTYSAQERAAYSWMDSHLPTDALVLTGTDNGNRLPAFADVRVVYGHPFETPNAAEAEALMRSLLTWNGDARQGLERLRGLGVSWVLLGPEELTSGEPAWLSLVVERARFGEVAVYEVPGL